MLKISMSQNKFHYKTALLTLNVPISPYSLRKQKLWLDTNLIEKLTDRKEETNHTSHKGYLAKSFMTRHSTLLQQIVS